MLSKSDGVYFASVLGFMGAVIFALVIVEVFPKVSGDLRVSMFDNLITLDGVLFGFSAVMLGLFFRDISKISESTARASSTPISV